MKKILNMFEMWKNVMLKVVFKTHQKSCFFSVVFFFFSFLGITVVFTLSESFRCRHTVTLIQTDSVVRHTQGFTCPQKCHPIFTPGKLMTHTHIPVYTHTSCFRVKVWAVLKFLGRLCRSGR